MVDHASLPAWLREARDEIASTPEWLQLSDELVRAVRATLSAQGVGSFSRLDAAEQRALVRSAADAVRESSRFRLFSTTAWRLLDLHVDAEANLRVGADRASPSHLRTRGATPQTKAASIETLSAEGCTALLSRLSLEEAGGSCLSYLLGAILPAPLRRAVWRRLLQQPEVGSDYRARCANGRLAVLSSRDAAVLQEARAVLAESLTAKEAAEAEGCADGRARELGASDDGSGRGTPLSHPFFWMVPLAIAFPPHHGADVAAERSAAAASASSADARATMGAGTSPRRGAFAAGSAPRALDGTAGEGTNDLAWPLPPPGEQRAPGRALSGADEDLALLVELYAALLRQPRPSLPPEPLPAAERQPAPAAHGGAPGGSGERARALFGAEFDRCLSAADPPLWAHLGDALNGRAPAPAEPAGGGGAARRGAGDAGRAHPRPPHFDDDGSLLPQTPVRSLAREAVDRLFVGAVPIRTVLYIWDTCLVGGWSLLAPIAAAWLIALRAPLLEARTAAEARGALRRAARALSAEDLQRPMEAHFLPRLRDELGVPLRSDMDYLAFGEPHAGAQRSTRYLDALHTVADTRPLRPQPPLPPPAPTLALGAASSLAAGTPRASPRARTGRKSGSADGSRGRSAPANRAASRSRGKRSDSSRSGSSEGSDSASDSASDSSDSSDGSSGSGTGSSEGSESDSGSASDSASDSGSGSESDDSSSDGSGPTGTAPPSSRTASSESPRRGKRR